MIFITGDCHGEFQKFSTNSFPLQKQMTKEDIVIICGDFGGVWDLQEESAEEKYWLDWLDQKPFTTVFADGNHENFDRLNHDYEMVNFHGGKAHKIRNSVYHLMRGEVFDFEGERFFVFGGASSHDVDDGILYREDFESEEAFRKQIRQMTKQRKLFRVNKLSWWEEELPCEVEFANAENNLAKVDYKVDYVITHCTAQSVLEHMYSFHAESDKLTRYFDDLLQRLQFKKWYFGHYHEDRVVTEKFIALYDDILCVHI